MRGKRNDGAKEETSDIRGLQRDGKRATYNDRRTQSLPCSHRLLVATPSRKPRWAMLHCFSLSCRLYQKGGKWESLACVLSHVVMPMYYVYTSPQCLDSWFAQASVGIRTWRFSLRKHCCHVYSKLRTMKKFSRTMKKLAGFSPADSISTKSADESEEMVILNCVVRSRFKKRN